MAGTPYAPTPPRSYRSVKRRAQARATRERILAAAATEFERRGYSAATIRRIAGVAGVSVASVELSFATKPQLLEATISFAIRGDVESLPMLERPWARSAAQASSLDAFLQIVEGVFVESARRSAGLILTVFEAARQDASLAALADRLRGHRAETAAWLVDGLVARAPLRPAIARDEAIDTVWLLMDPSVFRALTVDRGWTPERVGSWFGATIRRLLLADQARAAARTGPGREGPIPSSPTDQEWRMS